VRSSRATISSGQVESRNWEHCLRHVHTCAQEVLESFSLAADLDRRRQAKNQHYEESVFAFSKGTSKQQPEETTEKLPWTVKSLPSTELATSAAMRSYHSFIPKPGYDFAPVSWGCAIRQSLSQLVQPEHDELSAFCARNSVPGARGSATHTRRLVFARTN
jgi:hypothetical protein